MINSMESIWTTKTNVLVVDEGDCSMMMMVKELSDAIDWWLDEFY